MWTPCLYTIAEPQAARSNVLTYIQHIWMFQHDELYISLHFRKTDRTICKLQASGFANFT
jgi:hypothetical protein